ncbi:YARHG domain-containing protein [Clostridium algidicarnis]|uniref:YARHG domain-containing protein n=1 Tax=Clostridium algidicarnis TaxID=37659 RepID=UPI001C0D9531|nr:YARHG domain-containing protein [Clostridium algidicarnis]MBU3197495.1 YARHG domain-containing protein [Clostridium algidicarnis]
MAWTTTSTVTEEVKDTNPNTYIKRAEMQLENCNYTQAIREMDEAIDLTKVNEKDGVKDQKLKIIDQFFKMAVNSINYSRVTEAIEQTRFCIQSKQYISDMHGYKMGIESILTAFFNNKQLPKNTKFNLVLETIESCIKISGNTGKYTTKFNEYKSLTIINDIERLKNIFDINNISVFNIQLKQMVERIDEYNAHNVVKEYINDLLDKIVQPKNYVFNSRFKIKASLYATNILIPLSSNQYKYKTSLSSNINSFLKDILANLNKEEEVLQYIDLVKNNCDYVKLKEAELLPDIYIKFSNYDKLLRYLDSNFDSLLLSNDGKLQINRYRDIIYSKESNVIDMSNKFFKRKAIPNNLIKMNFVSEFNLNYVKDKFYDTIDLGDWNYASELYSCVKRYFSYINLDESYLNKYWVHNEIYGDGKDYYNYYINKSSKNYLVIRRMIEFMIKFNEGHEAIKFVELLLDKLYCSKDLDYILKLFTIYEDVYNEVKPNSTFNISKSYIKFGDFIINNVYPKYKISIAMNENKFVEIVTNTMRSSRYSDIKDGILALKHYYKDTKVKSIIDEFRCKVERDIEQLSYSKINEGIEVICSSLNIKEDSETKEYLITYLENNIRNLDINDISQLITILKSKFTMEEMNYVTFANKVYLSGQSQKAIEVLKEANITGDKATTMAGEKIKLKAYKDLNSVEEALKIYEELFIRYLNSYDDEELLKEFYKYIVKNRKAKEGKIILNKYLNKYYGLPNHKKKLINNYLAKLDLKTLSLGKYVVHKYNSSFLKDIECFIRDKIKIIVSGIIIISLLAGLVVYLYRSSLQNSVKSEEAKSSSTINPKLDSAKNNENKTVNKNVGKSNTEKSNTEKSNSNKAIKDKYLVNNENPNAKFDVGNLKNTDFIFPNSDVTSLTYDQLMGKTLDELFVARNEMFARYGYEFSTINTLNDYFNRKRWYFIRKDYNGDLNTEVEKANANLIKQTEFDRIAYYNYGNKEITGQVISNSNKKSIRQDDINKLSDWELIIARNEIYARHGYEFSLVMLKDHFLKQNWYIKNSNFKHSDLSDTERQNVEVLMQEEEKRTFNALKRY